MLTLKSVNFEQREFQIHQLEKSHPEQTEWVIGRHTTCDLVLASPEVSRVHGRIVYLDSSYYFVDVGSASGSVLNGEIIPVEEPRQLQLGDLLQLGETFLHVEELTPLTDVMSIEPSNQSWNNENLVCRCCRIINETPDVKTFCFVAEPAIQFAYLPGQFVNIEVTIDNQTIIRPYSISSSPTRPYHLSITVKRVPGGLVSNWLQDHLKIGDRVKLIGGAMGRFTCVPNVPKKLLFISAGSGITPMMSMLRWLQDTLSDCDITFLHSAATPEDIIFRKELEAIADQMPNLRLAVTMTRTHQAWMGLIGRISESMLSIVVPDLLDRSVYVCGSEQFMQSIRTLLESIGFPMQNYQEESFGGQSLKPTIQVERNGKGSTQKNSASILHFTESDQQVLIEHDTPILEIAEQAGVQIRHACRAGACGMCKVKVRKGEVRYETSPTALSIADQEAGYALCCVAYPVDSLEVEA
ncbi:FHA domain-containing protein [Leptolyngbya sp. NIES-2104]|uniref:FHA domain-containing protein n=1 Tax=Leptolyngbya sp. NIES-2104 TaxID=1552121 RepID=UPI0006EC5447|nr:FHA domain-containing protein [Leptolyngbya sp. NIES-2104]GAP95543.1 flavodoxin reductase (ferredoxin-NADPH reductase) family 1 [Leptolyngbya sp. NIES-2104]